MILSCGDALIVMVPVRTDGGQSAYLPRVGGSCLIVAVAMARLGTRCGFVGGISSDFFGQMIRDRLLSAGVDLRFTSVNDLETTLAFVSLNRQDDQYVFYDSSTAARSWMFEPDVVDFEGIEAIHPGSVPLIGQSSALSFQALAYLPSCSCVVFSAPHFCQTLL